LGIFDVFSKESRKHRSIARLARVVANPKAAGEDRWAALLDLQKDGSGDAIYAMLCRYTYVAEVGTRSRVTDEQEKNLVADLITELGAVALPEIHRFLLSEEGPSGSPKHSISYALRLLEDLSPDPEDTWRILREVALANEPGYERDPSRKIELLTFLGEWRKDPRIADLILPYLDDADEGVRFQTVVTLLRQGHETAKAPLLVLLENRDESYQMRNRVLAGFIENGWTAEVLPFLPSMDEPGLMQAVEGAFALADPAVARDPLLLIGEHEQASDRIKSRVAEWFVFTRMSVHGLRGRLEKILPRGYKVAKKDVERFPEAMHEPFLTLAVEHLLTLEQPELVAEPLTRIMRNRELSQKTYLQCTEFLATKGWKLGAHEKALRKALPKGYDVDEEGYVTRRIEDMDEPFLTAAGDNLLDHAAADDESARQDLIEILINAKADERVRERILDRFDREGWSVLGYENDIERRLPREFQLSVVDHGRDYRIVRVIARI
jgi:hypothetical protein